MSGTASKLMFSSSTGSPAAKRRRKENRNGPVTVIQGPVPTASAKPQLSRATAEALFRSGGLMPSKNRLR